MPTEQMTTNTKSKDSQKQPKFKPLGSRVLVKRQDMEQQSKGGIILPDSAKKKPETAKVIAVGEGKKDSNGHLIPMPVKVGDIILMDKYSGQEITIENEEYVIVKAEDIIAIVE